MSNVSMRIGPILSLSLIFLGCDARIEHRVTHRGQAIPHLFVYTSEEVEALLKAAGVEDFRVGKLARNAEGDRLFVFPWRASDDRVAVLSSEGKLWIEKRPWPLDSPCDQEFLRIWYCSGREMQLVGRSERLAARPWWVTIDPSCSFFFAHLDNEETALASIHNPSRALFLAPFWARSIFRQGEMIYLFGDNWSWDERLDKRPELPYLVLTLRGDSAALAHQRRIPQATHPSGKEYIGRLHIEDMSPFSPKLLLIDDRDMPMWDRWILFDLDTGEHTNLGWTRGRAFFLTEDIIEAVQHRRQQRESGFPSAPTAGRASP